MSKARPKKTRSSPSSPPSKAGRRPKPDPYGPIRLPSDDAALKLGYYFDPESADFVCQFIESFCCHSTGRFSGAPFILSQWQRDLLRNLYGWKKPDGTRRFREMYCEVPKKNGKSTLLAAMALFGLFDEPGAEVYPGAVDREQASIIFNECRKMVEASPHLSKHLTVIESKKRIVFAANNAFLKTMSADVPNKDGLNSSLTILDELHRFAKPDLYDIMKYAGKARSEPILAVITTAGHDRRTICYEQHERALAVLNGTVEDLRFLPVIFAAQPEDDLDDPAVWRKANPSMGTVLSEEDFAEDHLEAKSLPRLWNAFLRLRLNIWTEQITRWIPLERWDALKDDASTWDLDGQDCYAAIDLSSTTDLTSLTLFFPAPEDGSRLHLTFTLFFIPHETAGKRAAHDKVPYPTWIKQGHMIATEGDATDHDVIRLKLGDLADRYRVLKVGMDPWNAQQLANQLVQDGFEVEFVRQGYGSLSGPSKAFERMVLAGSFRHDGNPVLRWNVANVAVEQDAAGNIKPSKKRSPERIDGAVSTVMAIGLAGAALLSPEPGFLTIGPEDDG